MKSIKNRQDGFTIIEVMIVLVIAAVILLIVFLAVPALQRNSRNTQRKNDAAGYASAVSEWAGNYGGQLPSAAADLTTGTGAVNNLANMGILTEPTTVTAAATTVTNAATVSTMMYVPGTVCAGSGNATSNNASARQFTILFATEGSGGAATPLCLAS